MAQLIVWLMICAVISAVRFSRSPKRVPFDIVRSALFGLLFGTVVYFFLAVASLPFNGE